MHYERDQSVIRSVIREGLEVRDTASEKIGTIGRVYVAVQSDPQGTLSGPGSAGDYFRIDTGFLGLGKDLWVPVTYISGVTDEAVMLTVGKDRVDTMGWDVKPASLGDES